MVLPKVIRFWWSDLHLWPWK